MSNNKSLLTFIPYSSFSQWDVKHFFLAKISSSFSIEKLGEHLIHQTYKVQLSDYPDVEFGILGVSNKVGMFDADIVKGKKITQKYHLVKDGWLAYNPYRINVGSIGLKTVEQKGEYISPAYVVFSCKDTLLPEYMWLLMKTRIFNSMIKDSTTGSVRQTLHFEKLAEICAPIPSIKQQKKIIDEYHKMIAYAEKLEREAIDLENGIDNYLLDIFNLKHDDSKVVENEMLTTISLSDCGRWDVEYALNRAASFHLEDCNCEIKSAGTFIASTQYGLSEKANKGSTGIPIIRMGNIKNSELDLEDMKYLPLSAKLNGRYLDKGDLLFNRTNSKELVGKTAVFNLEGDYVFASYIIRVKLDTTQVNVDYINYMFASSIIRKQIDIVSRQVLGQVNINVDELCDLKFPIPPIKSDDETALTQERIVVEIERIRGEVKSKYVQAKDIRQKAHEYFENMVFII